MSKPGKPGQRNESQREQELLHELEDVRARLEEAEATIQAIQSGGVDALIVSGPEGDRVFALEGADYPYRVIIEVMNEGVLVFSANGDILSCNSRFAAFVGASAAQLLGKSLFQFVIPQDVPKLRTFLREPAVQNAAAPFTLQRADRSTLSVNLSVGNFEVGGMPVLCVVVTDLTESIAAAEARQWLSSIVETSNDAIISLSLDDTILTWNAAAERIYGYAAHEAIGLPISIIIARDARADAPAMQPHAGRRLEGFETIHVTKGGARIHVSLSLSPLLDADGYVAGTSIIARDISERKRNEAELERHRRNLEEMVQQRTEELALANASLHEEIEERKRVEVELRESESFKQAILNSLTAHIAVLDEAGRIIDVNEPWLQFARENGPVHLAGVAVGANYLDVCRRAADKEDPVAAEALGGIQRVLKGESRSFVLEYPCHSPWERRWFLMTVSPTAEAGGAVVAHLNVTERKLAEQALRESEERFRFLFDSSLDAILLTVPDGEVIAANPAACAMFGMLENELCAKGRDGIFDRTDPRLAAALAERASTGRVQTELTAVRGDGTQFPVDVSSVVVGSGRQRSYIIMRDITERKQAEEANRFQSLILEGINSVLNAALVSQDEEQLGRACLDVAEQMTQSPFGFISRVKEERMEDIAFTNPGWDPCVVTDGEGHQWRPRSFEIHGIYGRVLSDARSLFTNEPAAHPDRIGLPPGHPPLHSFLGVPLIRESRVVGMIGVANREGGYTMREQEILEALAPIMVEAFLRKKAEEEIMRSNKELEQFAYVASHDLQEPLRQIVGFTQMIEKRYAAQLDESGVEFIGYIVEGGKRMQALIQDLLTYSRVGRGGRQRAFTNIQDVIEAAIRNLGASIEESHAVVTHDTMPVLKVDRLQMVQVFQNLIGNAIKFRGEADPRIHIGACPEANTWLFSVSDNGIGFQPQYTRRIFEVFQRLHNREEYPGTGIGLPICKRVVENHGGRIWAESEPGKGATFYFTIPL